MIWRPIRDFKSCIVFNAGFDYDIRNIIIIIISTNIKLVL